MPKSWIQYFGISKSWIQDFATLTPCYNSMKIALTVAVPSLIMHWYHSRPQRPRSFWSAPRISTFDSVQRHSGFEWLCKHNRLRQEPWLLIKTRTNQICETWLWACADWREVRELRTSGVGPGQRYTAVKWVRMLKTRACGRARVGMGCKSKCQNGGTFKFHGICFYFAGIRRKQNSSVRFLL